MPDDALLPLTAAGLLITDWCPARCRHCYVMSGPARSAWMPVAAAAGHLAALARLGVPADGIHIGGGEPFGDFDRLLAILRSAADAGLDGIGYVETCGFWATSETLVRDRLVALVEAGMRRLSISADPYHQEFVPPDRVRRLHEVACSVLGPEGVRARRWKWLEAPRDVSTLSNGDRRRLFTDSLHRYPERMTGRAAEELAPLLNRTPAEGLPEKACRSSLLESRHVHVLPGGEVYPGTCAGLVPGRATARRPLDEVVRSWRPADSPHVAALVSGGPQALLPEARRCGFVPHPEGYADACHLCWALRSHLVRAGRAGDDLGPAALYAEAAGEPRGHD
ncbi:MAG: radical SAM protein [Phycisphaerae bacterium]